VVLEVLTTAGFGGDAPWSSPEMNAVIIGMNLTGVVLVFFAIPFFAVPFLERIVRTAAPTESSLSDHVIVCADSPRETALRAEMDDAGIPSLFVKRDAELVRELVRGGAEAIHGDPETEGTLENANVSDARAMVVDINDEVNANTILTARRLEPEIRIVSVVENSDTEAYHRYAGADEVVRPRVAVGQRLAAKARGTSLRDAVRTEAGDRPELAEVLVSGSELAGQTLSESQFGQRSGATVLGGWFHGEFVAPVDPDRPLVEHAVLLVAGETEGLTTLQSAATRRPCDRVVVVGYGVVGRTVAETLRESGVGVTVVNREETEGVDVVGDVTEPATLQEAGVADADRVVLCLSRDSLVVFSALVIQEHAPDVEVLARADNVEYVRKCYDAGVEYTLARSEVTAHMAAARLFESHSEDRTQCELVRTQAPSLAGNCLGDTELRAETSVVAVERDGTLLSNPGPSFDFRENDVLILAGTEAGVAEFERRYGTDS